VTNVPDFIMKTLSVLGMPHHQSSDLKAFPF